MADGRARDRRRWCGCRGSRWTSRALGWRLRALRSWRSVRQWGVVHRPPRWCSRVKSRGEWGPSGTARLGTPAGGGVGAVPVRVLMLVVVSGRWVWWWWSAGWVVRCRPVGSVQVMVASGCSRGAPAGALFGAVVAAAEGGEVGGGGGAGGPGGDVVEVAEAGGDVAAGEPAPPVAGLDQGGEPGSGAVGGGGQGVVGVGEGAGGGVARHDAGPPEAVPAGGGGADRVVEPAAGHEDRVPGRGPGHLDEVASTDADRGGLRRRDRARRGSGVRGGGGWCRRRRPRWMGWQRWR